MVSATGGIAANQQPNRSAAASSKLDSVASLLATVPGNSAIAIEWIESQREIETLCRRAKLCLFSGWLMLTLAAIVSAVVAWVMSRSVVEIFQDPFGIDMTSGELLSMSSMSVVIYTPWLLAAIAVALVLGGLTGFVSGRLPGLHSTLSALQWSSASNAVTRLLSAGFTFPQAFRATAQTLSRGHCRSWLLHAADRVEAGKTPVSNLPNTSGDVAVLELLLGAAESQPQAQWQLASDHFLEVGRRRLMLLSHSVPLIATVLTGFLIWISISATLGWMWKAVGSMVNGFGF
ncbi:hypothetical protein [Rubripirellula reticaptiva]|uniref:Type II secretion system protein GspF domain-containing protein n=1 Tax=Rubripirellula reticaptiva TaxID=2528013 RepID=A0A5C6EQN8_9BACT|nr:hypothetical protein [Rubripirellula reticaptiva]TWU51362.1 hypothetical protein Poly59_29540 [Rubripirellula reticaptiva]